MSDLQEPKLPIQHSPIAEPAASDGSPLRVIRDAQGQISEASGTGRDGVVRRLTVTRKSATNPTGFHFVGTQLDFYENGREYLRVGSIFSPDAGKASFQAYSETSQFGFAVGISRARNQAMVVTTTGSRVTVDLSQVSPLSALTQKPSSSLPAPSVQGPLTPPSQGIQDALRKAEYFQPLFEQERSRFATDLEAALHSVNLSATMHADELVSRLSGIMPRGRRPANLSKGQVVALSGGAAGVGGALVLVCVEAMFTITIPFSIGLLISVVAGLVVAAIVAVALTVDQSPSAPPTGTNDTPPAEVEVPPLQPPNPNPPPTEDGGVPDDGQKPPTDGGVPSDAPQTPADVSAWDSLPDGDTSPVGVASGSPSESSSGGGNRTGGGDASSESSGDASGSPSESSSSGTAGDGGPGESSGGGNSGGDSGGNSGNGGDGGDGGGDDGGDGGGGGGESIGTGGVLKKPEGDDSSDTSSSTSSTPKRPPEPPPTI